MTKTPSRFREISQSVASVMTTEWQSSAMIASQVVFPPDFLQRLIQSQREWVGKPLSTKGAASSAVSKVGRSLVAKGIAEKRYVHGNKCEFRLLCEGKANDK